MTTILLTAMENIFKYVLILLSKVQNLMKCVTCIFLIKKLKQTFFNSILNVEHHLKSIFAYRFAEKFKNKRYAYLDINSYDPNKTLSVGRLISDLSRTIKSTRLNSSHVSISYAVFCLKK